MTKVIEFKPDVPDIQSFTNEEMALQTQTKFNEVYKLKNVTATVPTYIPNNELDCYVRYVNGTDYYLYVYLGKTVGWKKTTLS